MRSFWVYAVSILMFAFVFSCSGNDETGGTAPNDTGGGEGAGEKITLSTPSIVEVSSNMTNAIYLAWTSVENASGYEVWRADTSNGTFTLIESNSTTAMTDNLALKAGKWFYKIRAYSDGGVSEFSDVVRGKAVGWNMELLDIRAKYTSIVLDSNDNPHISFYWVSTGLGYAYKDSDGWHTNLVDSGNEVGKYSAIAMDSNGYICIAYQDDASQKLKYAHQTTSGWDISSTTDSYVLGFISLCVDSNNVAHFGYEVNGTGFKHATNKDGTWGDEIISSTLGYSTGVATVPGYVHLVYSTQTFGDKIMYEYLPDGGVWIDETIDNIRGDFVSVDVDRSSPSDQLVRVSYIVSNDLKYAYRSGGSWTTKVVDDQPSVTWTGCEYTSLKLDSSGNPHIVYMDLSTWSLKYAVRSGGSWKKEIVIAGLCGGYGSLALDSDGNPHISFTYYNAATSDTKLGYIHWVK